MATRYRKIEIRIWNDEKFMSLSDDAKLVFLFLLTHPNMTSIGAMRGTVPGLSSELGWLPGRLSKAFGEALAKGLAKHNDKASFIAIKNFLKYNRPESPNVVKSWDGIIELIPECQEKNALITRVKAFAEGLGKAYAEALPEAFRKAMPNPEPEPEPEPNTPPTPQGGGGDKEGGNPVNDHDLRLITLWNAYPQSRRQARTKAMEWLKKNIKSNDMFNTLMDRLGEDKNSLQWKKENGQYIPLLTTWLNKRRHEDPAIGNESDLFSNPYEDGDWCCNDQP